MLIYICCDLLVVDEWRMCHEVHYTWFLAPPISTVGEATQEQRDMISLSGVFYNEDNLHIWVKAGLSDSFPVLSRLKSHFVNTRYKHLFWDQSWAASIFISCPCCNQTPSFSRWVLSIKAKGHVWPRDTHCSVQYMGGQWTNRACHRWDLIIMQKMTLELLKPLSTHVCQCIKSKLGQSF